MWQVERVSIIHPLKQSKIQLIPIIGRRFPYDSLKKCLKGKSTKSQGKGGSYNIQTHDLSVPTQLSCFGPIWLLTYIPCCMVTLVPYDSLHTYLAVWSPLCFYTSGHPSMCYEHFTTHRPGVQRGWLVKMWLSWKKNQVSKGTCWKSTQKV